MIKQGKVFGAVAIVLMSMVVLLACGESSHAASVVSGGGSTTTKGSGHFKVGQQVKIGSDYIVTVNSIKASQGDEFTQPKPGNTIAIVDVTIKNTSSKGQDISSALNFTFQDATGQKYDETVISGATPPDGTVAAGGLLRGQLAYEVPKTQHAFTFAFQADITSTDQTIWDLTL